MVLMPFYGVAVGTGHSVVSTRFAYLNLTFWSHYRVFPHIGVVVGTEEDYAFVTSKACGLPWAEVAARKGRGSVRWAMWCFCVCVCARATRRGGVCGVRYVLVVFVCLCASSWSVTCLLLREN